MADCANLHFSVNVMYDNIGFTWSGFNDSMPAYITESISKLQSMPQEDLRQIFDQVKEKLMIDWKNCYLIQSYQQAFQQFTNVIYTSAIEKKILRAILETYTYENFMDHLKNWLKKGRYVWYICGNYHHEEAIKLVENVRAKFALEHMKVDDIGEVQPLKLEEGCSYLVRLPLDDVKNENSAVLAYYQGPQAQGDIKKSLLNQLVMQYISEPFFDDLRTKQQLGYVVFSRHDDIRDVLGC